ncbi:MAG: hypothetical protein EOP10_31435, partial [Proteobacteria bacterium]
MHRIDSAGSVNGRFVEKDKVTGKPGTVFAAKWLNNLQEEICSVIEGAGLVLSEGDNAQLLKAIESWQSPKVIELRNEVIDDFPNLIDENTGGPNFTSRLKLIHFPSGLTRINIAINFSSFDEGDRDDVYWSFILPDAVPLPDEATDIEEIIFGDPNNDDRRFFLNMYANAQGNFWTELEGLQAATGIFGVKSTGEKCLAIQVPREKPAPNSI